MAKLLEIQDLVLRFYTYEGVVKALEEVNLEIQPGETFGLVGETGCGKTVTALSVLVLHPPQARIEKGAVLFHREEGELPVNLVTQKDSFLQRIRGKEISMVFQEPGAALNPLYTVEEQISEVLLLHRRQELCQRILEEVGQELEQPGAGAHPLSASWRRMERALYRSLTQPHPPLLPRLLLRLPIVRRISGRLRKEIRKTVVQLLREMGIPDAEKTVRRYPHELSGGMKQRVVIAMALACYPRLLIADEPTTSLDVTIQAQILDLLRQQQKELGSSILYITHNLGVVAEMCQRVGVMYAGTICEVAEVQELFHNPLHPYTRALLEAIPKPQGELKTIAGMVPHLIEPPSGCRFHPRCPQVKAVCSQRPPRLTEITPGHRVACYLYPGAG